MNCQSCGFDHEVTDDAFFISWEAYRAEWVRRGMPWYLASYGRKPPVDWDPVAQLRNAIITSQRQFAPPAYPRNDLYVWLAASPTLRARPPVLMAFVEDVLTLLRPYGIDILVTDEPCRYRDTAAGLAAFRYALEGGAVGRVEFDRAERSEPTGARGSIRLCSTPEYHDATTVSLTFDERQGDTFAPPINECIALVERWAEPLSVAAAGMEHGRCATHRDGSLYLSQREREHGHLHEWQAVRRFVRGITWGTMLGPELCARLGDQASVLQDAPVAIARPLDGGGVWLQLSETPPAPLAVLEPFAAYLDPVRDWTYADIKTAPIPPRRVHIATPLRTTVPFPTYPIESTGLKRGDTGLALYFASPPTQTQIVELADAIARWDDARNPPARTRQHEWPSESIFHALQRPRYSVYGPAVVGNTMRWRTQLGFGERDSDWRLPDLCSRIAEVSGVQIDKLVVGTETLG